MREGLVLRLSESYRFFEDDEEGPEGEGGAPAAGGPHPEKAAGGGGPLQDRPRYRFLHDRVQQATYALIPEGRRKVEHLKIGRLLLANAERREEALFDIVAHLNVGRGLLDDAADRLGLAQLNYQAGKRAKAALAITVANEYFATALDLLPADRWASHYELTRDIHREHGECVYVLGGYDRSEELLTEAIAHARDRYDRGVALECKMRLYLTQGGTRETRAKAVTTGLEALEALGYAMPMTGEGRAAKVAAVREETARRLAAVDVKRLADLPRMADPERLLVMTTIVTLFGAAYITGDMDLLELCTYSIVGMSLEHGNSDVSSFGYVMYGMLQSAQGEHRRAYEFGRLGLLLQERYPNLATKTKVNNVFGHSINPFVNHFETNLPHYRATYECCLESGDLLYGLWSVLYILWVRILKGDPLHEIYEDSASYMGFVERCGDENLLLSVQCLRQAVQCLRGLTDGVGSLDSDGFREADLVRQFHDSQSTYGQCWHAIAREIVDVTLRRYDGALEAAGVAERTLGSLFAFFNSTTHEFYAALALAGACDDAPDGRRREYLARLDRHAAKLESLADNCPDNFLHCYQLVEAERARLRGDGRTAAELYDLAIQNAEKGRFLNHVALGLELAGTFYVGADRPRLARLYLGDAHDAYARWGADAKVQQLEQLYPHLLEPKGAGGLFASGARDGQTTTTTRSSSGLDLNAVISAAQALAGEIELDRLIERVMRIVVESSGAQRGVLALTRAGELRIAATMAVEPLEIAVGLSAPALDDPRLPASVINAVARTAEPVVLADARHDGRFAADRYVQTHGAQSILCLAMMHQGRLAGVLYLENAAAAGAFTPARVGFCGLIAAQAAIALENALLIDGIRQKTEQLRRELHERTLAQEALAQAYARVDAELLERKRGEAARAALEAELSRVQTPLIPITDRIVVMPLIGAIDERRAAQVLETAMHGVEASRAEVVIIDITGLSVLDTTVLNSILSAVNALGLLGTQAVITGMRPDVARRVVELDVNLGSVVTLATLQRGVEYAMRRRKGGPGSERRPYASPRK